MTERRSEWFWCGRLCWSSPGSFRGGLFLRKRRRNAGKCDNLSFLRVLLSQRDKVLGGANGYGPLFEDGWSVPSQVLLFDSQQRVINSQAFSTVR